MEVKGLISASQVSQRSNRTKKKAENVSTSGQRRRLPETTSPTVDWHALEEWQKDNEYIVSGYRRLQYSWRGCFISLFAFLHNETVNIHTHLWGAVLFAYYLGTFYETYVQHHEKAAWQDVVVIAIFLSAAIVCLICSATFHTSGCHSHKVATRCHAYDYSGIVILTVGSFYPSIYYGFYCDSFAQRFYLTTMTLGGVGAAYIVLNPEYAKPTHRGARTAVFVALGLSAVVPVTHWFLTHDYHVLITEMGVDWLILSGALYIVGALLYANRIPERLSPGRFDYLFASHQIFHVCVVLAALAHYQGVLTCLRYRMAQPQCFLG